EVHRAIGVTQKTAWFMLHRLRLAMQGDSKVKLGGGGGIVEVDETWIGGAARWMNKKQRARHPGKGKMGPHAVSGKAIVFGMMERGGRVIAKAVRDVQSDTLLPAIKDHVDGGSEVHSDAHPGYAHLTNRTADFLPLEQIYEHKVVDHTVEY